MKPLHEQAVSQTTFAHLVGVSPALVSHLVRSGALKRGGSLGEWVRAYVERAVELSRPPAGAEPSELAAERLALLKARRELAQVEAKRAKAEVMPADDLTALLTASYTALRQVLLSWIGMLPTGLAHREPAEVQARLQDEVHRLLEDLHREQPRYTLRCLRWTLKHAPDDLWQHATPFEDDPIARAEAAVDEREAETATQ